MTDHAALAARFLDGRSWVSAPEISPDGHRTAFVVSTIDLAENTTITRIWLDGAPLTAGPYDANPTWSPDGRSLAFTSKRGEKESDTTLHVMPAAGPGEVRTVCTMPDRVADVVWSPDGAWIAFTSRARDERYEARDVRWQRPRRIDRFFSRLNDEDWIFDRPKHVFVVSSRGIGRPRDLTPGEFQHAGVTWLRDSSGVVTAGRRTETWDVDHVTSLYVVPLHGEIRALTAPIGNHHHPAVSPDGTLVAFVGTDTPLHAAHNHRVGVVEVATGEHRWISSQLDRSFVPTVGMRAPVWADGGSLFATAEDRGDTHLFRVHVDGAAPEAVTDGRISVAGFHAAGATVALAVTTVEHPAELHTLTRRWDLGRITDLTDDQLGWEKFTAPCTDGSDEIDAWIMRPADFDPMRRYPVLLDVHGGPFTQYGEYYFDEAQMQAAAGFVVVMSNPRGGSGRTSAWAQAIAGPKHPDTPGTGWGSVDIDDVLAVLDTARERYPFCDSDRVGMLGGSYGGYVATHLAAVHGHRFRGICSERSINNLLTSEWESDIGTELRTAFGVDIVTGPDELLRMSPSTLAHQIEVPLLIVHSENDFRCPIGQAEELWMTLKLLGRDVTFYRFPGENHELSRTGSPLHRQMRAEIILDWFADKLAAS